MKEKLTTLEEAAGRVKSSAVVVMNALMNNAPMALLRQLVRQGTRDLRVAGVTGGAINIDFLAGAGVASIVDTGSVTLGEYARGGPNFIRCVIEGRLQSLDNT